MKKIVLKHGIELLWYGIVKCMSLFIINLLLELVSNLWKLILGKLRYIYKLIFNINFEECRNKSKVLYL